MIKCIFWVVERSKTPGTWCFSTKISSGSGKFPRQGTHKGSLRGAGVEAVTSVGTPAFIRTTTLHCTCVNIVDLASTM